ncbi:MAG: hypothetical protein R3336_07390, partial [Phycisphaeraceae bacterium]|nr:hypothetical protein [Phycisphaeraceae bacterium]
MSDARVCFPLLADPGDYQACTWPLTENETRRAYWLGLFRRHFPMLLDEAVVEGLDRGVAENDLKERSEAAREAFFAYLDELEADPSAYGELDILTICLKREEVLRAHAFDDPYRLAKKRENDAALAGLGQRLRDLAA